MAKKAISSLDKTIVFSPRFVLKQTKKEKTLTQVYLTLTIKGERLRYYTGLRIEPKYWDSKNMKPGLP